MYKVGITGGIAAGKSMASNFFKNKNNSYIFNADKESKRHLKKSHSLQKKLIHVFGNDISKNKKIDIEKLAKIAFANPTNHKILNGIMWPEIYLLIEKKIEELENNYKMFIVDAALIFEANLQHLLDSVLLITADKNIRIKRSSKKLNLSKEQIQNRIKLQMDENKKKKLANHTIQNNKTISELNKNLKLFYNSLILNQL